MGEPKAIEAAGVSKRFGDTQALDDVDFTVELGEVHALVGQNGAGKSTLLKVLQGVYEPDEGEISILGSPVSSFKPRDLMDLGVSMIFQDFSLVPSLTAVENVFLGRQVRKRSRFLDRKDMHEQTRVLFEEVGIDVDPGATVGELSPGYQQLTEVAKAVARDAKILIMDEPTASLAKAEVDKLFELIDRLRQRGTAIVYVSHRLDEVFAVSDRITVLRDGQHVVTTEAATLTVESLVDHIVGKRVEAFEWVARPIQEDREPVLAVEGLSAAGGPHDVDLSILPGEIVGVAGLMGSGRSSLARALMGLAEDVSGSVRVAGRALKLGDPAEAVEGGLALVPENRRTQGLVTGHSVERNLGLPVVHDYARAGFVKDAALRNEVADVVTRMQVKPTKLSRKVALLSGGNAQKVVIGKWLLTKSRVLILDEPTAGIDIGSKAEIIDIVRGLADEGMGVLVISSELAELAAMADRFLFMVDGRLVDEVEQRTLHESIEEDADPAERMAEIKQHLELTVQQLSATSTRIQQ